MSNLVDTGCEVNIMDTNTVTRLGLQITVWETPKIMFAINNTELQITGLIIVPWIGIISTTFHGMVCHQTPISQHILGRTVMDQLFGMWRKTSALER